MVYQKARSEKERTHSFVPFCVGIDIFYFYKSRLVRMLKRQTFNMLKNICIIIFYIFRVMFKLCCLSVCVGRFIKLNSLQLNLYSPLLEGNKIWCRKNVHIIFVSFTSIQVPCEHRLHFLCVSWRAKSSLCPQPFNFLSCMREIPHAIRKEN